ncbi:MAG: hypothetical protein JSR77_13855 [Planctomycetes bacterium]|nr:hypothetical protein [Planctomycetota bacterium]
MKRACVLVFAVLVAGLMGSGRLTGSGAEDELAAKPWLYEVVRHAYRWYIDEKDIDAVAKANEVVFWVRETKPKLDEGDQSRFGEVILPQFSLRFKVKRADYTIPELNVQVKTDTFKIVSVSGADAGGRAPEGFTEVKAGYAEMREHLFKTRALAAFPDGALMDRMRLAVRSEIVKEYADRKEAPPEGKQTVYFCSLSPVANEAWVFWETGKMLIRFASDIDLANPSVWEHEKLAVRTYHLDSKVVVSLDEVAGSNAFMTRNQAGRALFNCIVLGKKVELQPGVPVEAPK